MTDESTVAALLELASGYADEIETLDEEELDARCQAGERAPDLVVEQTRAVVHRGLMAARRARLRTYQQGVLRTQAPIEHVPPLDIMRSQIDVLLRGGRPAGVQIQLGFRDLVGLEEDDIRALWENLVVLGLLDGGEE